MNQSEGHGDQWPNQANQAILLDSALLQDERERLSTEAGVTLSQKLSELEISTISSALSKALEGWLSAPDPQILQEQLCCILQTLTS